MAVQGNLLSGSDLSRMVEVAAQNRPQTLGEFVDARQTQQQEQKMKLAEIQLDYTIRKEKLAQELALGRKDLDLKEIHYQNEKDYRDNLLAVERSKVTNQKRQDELADIAKRSKNFIDAISYVDPISQKRVFVDKEQARALFKTLFKGVEGVDFEEDFGSFFALEEPSDEDNGKNETSKDTPPTMQKNTPLRQKVSIGRNVANKDAEAIAFLRGDTKYNPRKETFLNSLFGPSMTGNTRRARRER